MALSIATCTYSEFDRTMGIPIRTTVGQAKWFPHYPYGVWQNVTPDPWMLNMGYDQFNEKYRQKLDRIGFDTLLADAQALHEELAPEWMHDDRYPDQLVVLCFDNLAKPGKWCHRTIFGTWMGEHGFHVPELGRCQPIPKPDHQGKLW